MTLTATDVYRGWTINVTIRNRAHCHVVAAIEQVAGALPYPVVGLDCDNGGEFSTHALIAWCADRAIFVTRARAHASNDCQPAQAIVIVCSYFSHRTEGRNPVKVSQLDPTHRADWK